MAGLRFVVLGAALAVAGGEAAPSGWSLVDDAGVRRHAALGLFQSLTPVQAEVTKSAQNPLFGQDQPWETRIDNGYPNVVYDEESAARGDGPWRLWYGNIGDGGQYLLYANSTDGLHWEKPDLNRYDLRTRWSKSPDIAKHGKHNNIVMFGGGLGMYRDLHETNASLRYKVSGGAPGFCYDDTGDKDCLVGTAGSPNGIDNWGDAQLLGFPAPWRPDCHTNLYYDEPLRQYLMTTRSYESADGREISIARTGGGNRTVFQPDGTWSVMYENEYPASTEVAACFKGSSADARDFCGAACLKTPGCKYFWVYTAGDSAGTCCMKSDITGQTLLKPSCTTCGGQFVRMGGRNVTVNATEFDSWQAPLIVERGTAAHQLYSQITWRFYDIFLGIVMTFDAQDPAGHVHCMLSWSPDAANWTWVDPAGLAALKEFIPAGPAQSFESHVCFAAHLPLKMPDGTTRLYYMGGDGPHSGARKSSFALATLPPDRFAGVTSSATATATATAAAAGTVSSRAVEITGSTLVATVDIAAGGSFSIGIDGSDAFARSKAMTGSGTDVQVVFEGQAAGLAPLVGQQHKLRVFLDKATLHTIGFKA